MKIIGISDIHGNLIDIPKCDILCIAGDVIGLNNQRDPIKSEHWWKTRFLTWIMKQPCDRILVIPGNHDFYLEQLYKEDKWIEFCDYMAITTNGKLHFLIDQSYYYKGIHFYGCPWIEPISFQIGKWAFENNNFNHDNPYSKIPECDILITYDSPINNELLNIESWHKCKYHFYGHWHEGASMPDKEKYNCSILNDFYNLKANYNFIEINMKTKYELLQEFAEEIKDNLVIENLEDLEKTKNKIDEILVKFLDNPKDTEDEIPWDESSMIDDDFGTDEPDIDDEYK